MSKKFAIVNSFKYFHDGGPYHIETSPLIYKANQWTGFYMIGAAVTKELIYKSTGKFPIFLWKILAGKTFRHFWFTSLVSSLKLIEMSVVVMRNLFSYANIIDR